MEFIGEDVAVYFGDECLGAVDEREARKMLAGKKAVLVRNDAGSIRKLLILEPEAADQARAMSVRDGSGSGGISPTYVEYYEGIGREQTAEASRRCTTLKKIDKRTGELKRYADREGFRRRRFNPDHLPQPLIPVRRNQALAAAWQ